MKAKKVPNWKQPASVRDPEAGKAKVEAEGRCRLCKRRVLPLWMGGSRLDSLTRHHLVPKGMGRTIGGDDLDDNIMPLCGCGTRGCHGAVTRRERWALMAVRAHLTPAEEDYIIRKKGVWWLDRNYPRC